ncbi:MAG TPA: hypothetical protein VF167_08470 [Longimicrobiaceae bacterium]
MSGYVWVIEMGEYSDYRVVGVYDNRKDAKRVADRINASDNFSKASVAKWPLNPGVDALNEGLTRYRVLMLRDGSVEDVGSADGWSGYEMSDNCWIWRRSQAPAYRGKGVPDALNAQVWAKDERHAVKIANEVRLQMIAGGKWKP